MAEPKYHDKTLCPQSLNIYYLALYRKGVVFWFSVTGAESLEEVVRHKVSTKK